MTIKEKSGNLTMAEMYRLTKSPDIAKMSTVKGQEVEIDKFIVYEDANVSTGEISTIVAISTPQGETYASNSRTFTSDFMDIIAMCREANEPMPKTIKVLPKTGKSGREYLLCAYIN